MSTVSTGGGFGVTLTDKWHWKCPTCKQSGSVTTQVAALKLIRSHCKTRKGKASRIDSNQ